MCAHAGRERPVCLGVGDLMTPLTALIHTQVLVHIWGGGEKKNHTTSEGILPTESRLCQSGRRGTLLGFCV